MFLFQVPSRRCYVSRGFGSLLQNLLPPRLPEGGKGVGGRGDLPHHLQLVLDVRAVAPIARGTPGDRRAVCFDGGESAVRGRDLLDLRDSK